MGSFTHQLAYSPNVPVSYQQTTVNIADLGTQLHGTSGHMSVLLGAAFQATTRVTGGLGPEGLGLGINPQIRPRHLRDLHSDSLSSHLVFQYSDS